jgi:hypothetical protein
MKFGMLECIQTAVSMDEEKTYTLRTSEYESTGRAEHAPVERGVLVPLRSRVHAVLARAELAKVLRRPGAARSTSREQGMSGKRTWGRCR